MFRQERGKDEYYHTNVKGNVLQTITKQRCEPDEVHVSTSKTFLPITNKKHKIICNYSRST